MSTTGPTNPYEPPRAELDAAPATLQTASLANAVAGRYDFQVGDVMDEAWRLVKGMKASFWGAAVLVGMIYLVVDAGCGLVLGMVITTEEPNLLVKTIHSSIVAAVMTPLTIGLQMMCVRRALDVPISFSMAFGYFSKTGAALLGALLVMLLTYLGFLLLVIPGIYLVVGYMMWTQLLCDQELSVWEAMETSRKAIHHRWWSVFGLSLLVGLLTSLSALGLLIPLIWTIPWAMMVTGVLYKRIFYAPSPADTATPA
jgi:uncharacterized membrane protein YesL